jgi:uncharacterized protein YutE (UPF0331/DUF86 family)
MAALACLFVLVEQAVKLAANRIEGDFHECSRLLREEELISEEEFLTINQLREIRNRMFHESHYAWFVEISGVAYPLSEDETKGKLFAEFSDRCFAAVLKLVEGSHRQS